MISLHDDKNASQQNLAILSLLFLVGVSASIIKGLVLIADVFCTVKILKISVVEHIGKNTSIGRCLRIVHKRLSHKIAKN